MRIIRARGPAVIDFIEDKLLDTQEYTDVSFADVLRGLLSEQPDSTCIYVCFKDEEILGFLVAYAPPNVTHVWLWQAWADPKLKNTNVTKIVFDRLLLWTEFIGRTSIRAETKRETEAMYRRWKFQDYSKIIEYKLSQADELEEIEVPDEHIRQSVDDEQSELATEADRERSVQEAADGVGHTDDSIPEPVDPESSAGLSTDV
jgi:hypothetical protein